MRAGRNDDLSLYAKLLLAAYDADRKFRAKSAPSASECHLLFSDLVVAAWNHDRQAFGLLGHEKLYPNSKTVNDTLWSKNGIVAKGWLNRVEANTFIITTLGKLVAKQLLTDRTLPAAKPTTAMPEKLTQLLQSKVYLKARDGKEVSRDEAFAWWGIAEDMPQMKALERLTVFGRELRMHDEYPEARSLFNVHEQLVSRFEKYLQLLRAAV